MGRKKGSKNKVKSEPAPGPSVAEDGFKHLFEGYTEVYEWVCKTAPDYVQSPRQRLVAIVKKAKDISEINHNRYGGKEK